MMKKTIMTALVSVLLMTGNVALADRCALCGGDPVVKQSLEDALAQLNAAAEAQKEEEKLEKCGCGKPKPKPPVVTPGQVSRADRDNAHLDAPLATGCSSCCSAMIKVAKKLKEMQHDSKKCCSKIKDKIDDVEDLVESQIDQAALCCSVTEALVTSLIEPLASTVDQMAFAMSINDILIQQIYNCTCL